MSSRKPKTEYRYDDRLLLKTNLIDSYLKALDFIKMKWPEKFYVENGDRKDLRELIFRELVANIIIHREYNNCLASEVVIYDDRLEATNPNRARFTGPINLETFEAEPKNPNIRAFFNVLAWADEIGSGIKNMNKYVRANSGAHPIFIEGESFKSVIPMQVLKIARKYELYLRLSQLSAAELNDERIAILKELPLDLSLKNVGESDELALRLISYWSEKSKELYNIRLLVNKQLRFSDFKNVGTWSKKSGELLKKRTRVLLGTLLLTLKPITLEALAKALGYQSKERYREDYVKPLKDNNLITYTMETANDPKQAYVITERGKSFLGGSAI